MWRGISLANKCLLLFSGALVLIVAGALTVAWFRMDGLVDDGQLRVSRQQVEVWEGLHAQAGPGVFQDPGEAGIEHAGIRAKRLRVEEAQKLAEDDRFIARAIRRLKADPTLTDVLSAEGAGGVREYRYVKAIRDPTDPIGLKGIVLLERRPVEAVDLLAVNAAYLISAGLVVSGVAVLLFYFILHKVILRPVRSLKETAERVRSGDLSTRSAISTGDEFEEMAGTFNAMLEEVQRSHDQMRAVNRALDVKLNELAEANTALFESAKLKGEFLASVSHELRTPLNSVIGFAELMREQAQAELDAGDDSTRLGKRVRYLENIVQASRGLLDLINGLLEMARIEAGRAEVNVTPVAMKDACEGLIGLSYPLAQRKGLELKLEAPDDLPVVETDLKKFQQIIFNFLSNAVKFTPGTGTDGKPGRVTLRAETLAARGIEGAATENRVRVSVIDTGPGIAPEDQPRLFQKFQQLDASHTREHTGTGLGLAISKELANLLQSEIQLVSDPGRGSMFSLILPLRFDPSRVPEQAMESRFRASLANTKAWAGAPGTAGSARD
ncbi:MAG: ATP-binding protein [Phycisphaerales bacterium]